MFTVTVFFSLLLLSVSSEPHSESASESLGRFRIISGRTVSIYEFPYQAALERYGQQWCGAAIVTSDMLVTAAHCIQAIKKLSPVPQPEMKVRVGHDESVTGGRVYTIKKVIEHEMYNSDPTVDEYDLAVIILTQPMEFNAKVQPIQLAMREPLDGSMAYVTGYGRTEPMRRSMHPTRNDTTDEESSSRRRGLPKHLMAIEIPIMNKRMCQNIHRHYKNVVTEKMICAGFTRGHKDSCKGDSGGPLAVDGQLVGVVAWGLGCGREGIPGVYTSIPYFRNWILDKAIRYSWFTKSLKIDEAIDILMRMGDKGQQ